MRVLFIFGLISILQLAHAQHKSDLAFIEHLINKGNFAEAIFLIKNDSIRLGKVDQDSLNYLHGWATYSIKNLDESTNSFLKVRPESPFYQKSRFFAGYNEVFSSHYQEATTIFQYLNAGHEPVSSLVNFELAGIDMLQDKWIEAKNHLQQVNPDHAALNQQVENLNKLSGQHEMHRKKSPLLAGIMSGIIPGSGKIYAGKTGAGIASLIGTTGFGLITWENYHKLGITHATTIFFGGIFLANYISNIYGSVISVTVSENEYQDATHNQILFQLHIPLRNFFD